MSLPIAITDILHGHAVEWERLKFKESWNPLKVLHTLCAFANDFRNLGGGYVVSASPSGPSEACAASCSGTCGSSPGAPYGAVSLGAAWANVARGAPLVSSDRARRASRDRRTRRRDAAPDSSPQLNRSEGSRQPSLPKRHFDAANERAQRRSPRKGAQSRPC